MTAKQPEPQQHWTVEKVHGLWWAWFPPRPDAMHFENSHGTRPRNLLGPFYIKALAEERLAKHLAAKR